MKLLIYKYEDELTPTGGPNGYLYNLKSGLDKIDQNIEIDFLKRIKNVSDKKHRNHLKMVKKIYEKMLDYRWAHNIKEKYLVDNGNDNVEVDVDFNNYDYIHFHSTFDMYDVRKKLLDCKAKIILTSHSPEPAYLEYISALKAKKIIGIKKFNQLSNVDQYAFNRADYIIFPCEEAEEPYYNRWGEYKNIHEKNKEKYRYILSGIKECTAKISREDVRKKYGIPNDAFLISYVGRHNEVKGYDLLKQIGEEVLNDKDTYFIIAGKEGPIYKLDNEHWIEVGWTNDPHSIISASNLFLLPNKETYFDLVLLEVMSLGVPVLASYTGGNKYFEKYQESGILYFNNLMSGITETNKLREMKKNELSEKGLLNKKIYESDFNERIFAKNYIELIKSLNI